MAASKAEGDSLKGRGPPVAEARREVGSGGGAGRGGALLSEFECGAGTVEAKRPSPTRSRGAAKSRQRRRSGALQLPELVSGAGTVLPCRPRRRNRSAAAP